MNTKTVLLGLFILIAGGQSAVALTPNMIMGKCAIKTTYYQQVVIPMVMRGGFIPMIPALAVDKSRAKAMQIQAQQNIFCTGTYNPKTEKLVDRDIASVAVTVYNMLPNNMKNTALNLINGVLTTPRNDTRRNRV